MSAPVRWEITHVSRFEYDAPVQESQNELRSCPISDDVQTLLHHRATTTPGARVQSYEDYWGTRVETFGVRGPHEALEVVAESAVVVGPRPLAPSAPVPMAALRSDAVRTEHGELLTSTGLVPLGPELVELAHDVVPPGSDVWATALALTGHVGDTVELVDGPTPVGTAVPEVVEAGTGGPRDRAHSLAALCRAVGIPTRYVSGHLATEEPDPIGRLHAWVEVLVPGHGWHALDPGGPVGQAHVTIGRGRDHADVPGLRGAFVGGDDHELIVTVTSVRTVELQPQQQQQQQ